MNSPLQSGALVPPAILFTLFMLGFGHSAEAFQVTEKVSEFGVYQGYSEPKFDSYFRESRYLEMRDGTKLAIDVMRPAVEGEATEEALPTIWTHTRYRRAFRLGNGQVQCAADSPLSFPLIEHGYNLVVVDVRGSGASYGQWTGLFTPEETDDAVEITEWIAEQPWCDGNVGMSGGSYLGITQLMTASRKPPALKALFPMVAYFDLYETAYHGGVYFDDFIRTWSRLTKQLDTESIAVGVDDDTDGRMLMEAVEDHKRNRALADVLEPLRFRDAIDPETKTQPYRIWQPAGFVDEINESEIPIYLYCGWFDSFARDGFTMFNVFENPCKLAMGAWSHSPRDPSTARETYNLAVIEQRRWFDYWLKGIENGVMEESPIMYHAMVKPGLNEWRPADEWPLEETTPLDLFLHEGPSSSLESVNDGRLRSDPIDQESAFDLYRVDPTTTSGTTSRWDNTVGGGYGYSDMTANDEKSLTFSSEVLDEDLVVTGHPIATLWISSSTEDADIFVFLEEVGPDNVSHYVTEGTLRASCRALHDPPWEGLSYLPWHRCHEADQEKLVPGQPVKLVIDLQPTSNIFNAGNRIRFTICGADKDNAKPLDLGESPELRLYRDTQHPSRITLPGQPPD